MRELQFPVGKHKSIKSPNSEVFQPWVNTIASFSADLKKSVEGLSQAQLQHTYRPNTWRRSWKSEVGS